MKKQICTYSLLLLVLFTKAQFPGMGGGGTGGGKMNIPSIAKVYGKVVDAKSKKPIEYASVAILWFSKDSVVAGQVTKSNGEFSFENMSFGGFRIKITFIGYKNYEEKFYLNFNPLEKDLGNIELQTDEAVLNEVTVVGEQSNLTMSIDRKTYNVDKDLSAKGGTGIDAVKNVPGVSVDADNNVTLRNQSVMILIDNRPTTLTLQQIPSDQIDRIEVITNPSVKYDASTTGGILNVILKKNNKPGYNGMVMTSIGTGNRYMGMANLNIKENPFNFFAMYSFNYGSNTASGYTGRVNANPGLGGFSSFDQWNSTLMTNQFQFGRFGMDYSINNRNLITLSGNFVAGDFSSGDNQIFGVYDTNKNALVSGDRFNNQFHGFKNYTGQLQYKKTWPKAGKELTGDVMYNYMEGSGGYDFTTKNYYAGSMLPNNPEIQRNKNFAGAHMLNAQIDYVNPITATKKIEWGLKTNYATNISDNHTFNYRYTDDSFAEDSVMTNLYQIDNMINGAYVNYSGAKGKLGYQGGLRFEQSYYAGTILNKDLKFSYNYPLGIDNLMNALFPAVYLSYKFKGQEIQANFSRKINRPNFFQLMPFVMFSDKFNFRIGNPQLTPEFINMAEINYSIKYKKLDYLTSLYGKYIEQPITNVAYPLVSDPNVLVNTSVNGKNSYNYGWENTFKFTIFKNLSVTSNTNFYYMTINFLNSNNELVYNDGYTWMTKLNMSYKFKGDWTMQVNGVYEAPKILPQGKTLEFYFFDLSLNKMIDMKYIFNLSVSDVMNSKIMGSYYYTPDFMQKLSRRRETRFIRFSFTWLFGKFDTSIFRRKPGKGDMQMMGGSRDGLDF
ncbi:MAG: outer membrane beta-barrel protein [Bacteroidota bacterium]|jgi:iron complex outermembrane receptor protein